MVKVANFLLKVSKILKEKKVALDNFYHDKHDKGYALVFDLSLKNKDGFEELLDYLRQEEGVIDVKIYETAS